MDPIETERLLSRKIHLAMLAALFLYGLLFAQIRGRMSASHAAPLANSGLFFPLLAAGIVQFAVISLIARKRLRSAAGPPPSRARLYFLLRAVSAEVLALFGLMIGFLGAPIPEVATLLALALAAMLSSFPTREAWQNALQTAQTPGS